MTIIPEGLPADADELDGVAGAINTMLRLLCDQLGVSTAFVARVSGGMWCITHVVDGAIGLQAGTELPLRDTY